MGGAPGRCRGACRQDQSRSSRSIDGSRRRRTGARRRGGQILTTRDHGEVRATRACHAASVTAGSLTVAITGSSGFLGQYFCHAFRRRGYRILALTGQPTVAGDSDLIRSVPSYTDTAALVDALQAANAQAIVHLAGRAHIRKDPAADPEAAFRVANIDSVEAVCRAAV